MSNQLQIANRQPLICEPSSHRLFFSIIVPVYNVAPYLRECLDSVLAQTFADWECLCVNDGSTDESGDILDEYAQKDVRFRVFHKKNGGVSSARNLGLDNAKGEWILFLDGDDCFALAVLERIYEGIYSAGHKVDLLTFEYKKFTSEWRETAEKTFHVKPLEIKPVNGHTWYKQFWSCAYRAVVGKNVRFSPFVMGEDRLYYLECLLKVKRAIQCSFVGYGYRQRETSIMAASWSGQKLEDELFVYFDIARLFSRRGLKMDGYVQQCLVHNILGRMPEWICRAKDEEQRQSLKARWHAQLCNVAVVATEFSLGYRLLFWCVGSIKATWAERIVTYMYRFQLWWINCRVYLGRFFRYIFKRNACSQ